MLPDGPRKSLLTSSEIVIPIDAWRIMGWVALRIWEREAPQAASARIAEIVADKRAKRSSGR